MQPAFTDAQRKHRGATSQAMRQMYRPCPNCTRKIIPKRVDITGLGHLVFSCRWCKAEWEARPTPKEPTA